MFVITNIANISNYLKSKNKKDFSYDFSLLNKSILVVFGLAIIIPMAFLFFLFLYGIKITQKKVIHNLCIYSYSNIFIIFGTCLSVFPNSLMEVIFLLTGAAFSILFLGVSFDDYLQKFKGNFKRILLSIIIIGQVLGILLYKYIFFRVNNK